MWRVPILVRSSPPAAPHPAQGLPARQDLAGSAEERPLVESTGALAALLPAGGLLVGLGPLPPLAPPDHGPVAQLRRRGRPLQVDLPGVIRPDLRPALS